MQDIYSFRPYQRKVTLILFVTCIVVGIIGSVTIYTVRTRTLFHATQAELKTIAENIASEIATETHESIVKPDDDATPAYTTLAKMFQQLQQSNPNIDDIYTLRPTANPNIFTFVVSAQQTEDLDGNGIVEQAEIRPAVGEEYDASDFPQLKLGLAAPTADEAITIDKWGAWVSGYAPLRNAAGATIGLVGVDYSASVIDQQRNRLIRTLLLVDVLLLPFLLIVAIAVARWLALPYKRLARAMYDVAHGDVHKQLPVEGAKSDRVFAELFNGMVQMIGSAKHTKDDEK